MSGSDLLGRLDDRSAQVAVLGQGYVGLVLAMRASEAGFPVRGFDVDEDRVASLVRGSSYVEDVTDRELADALARGYQPTADPSALGGFDVAVISVPTPLREGLPDISYIEAASTIVAQHLRPGCLVILESTTYPGTTEELVGPMLETGSGLVAGRDFHLGYSPERIDPGNVLYSLHNTPKIVSGIDGASLRAIEAFYGAFVEKLVPLESPAEAEMAKLIENTFRHVNVALVNELAVFAHDLGVDIWRAIDAASTKPFGFLPFRPGPGVGGHCLPIDPSYLSWQVRRQLGETLRFIELANDVNAHMPSFVVKRAQDILNRDRIALNGARILVLGLAYKAGTSDTRESPALAVVERLAQLGADVRAVDPYVRDGLVPSSVVLAELTRDEVAGADLVVLLTDHPDFDYPMVGREARRIFDTRNRMRALGDGNVELL